MKLPAHATFAGAIDGQDAAIVGQRVQDDGGVLARFDHLVEVADAAFAYGAGQRTVAPVGARSEIRWRPTRSAAVRSSWQATV